MSHAIPDSDLLHITAKTLADYEATAESFWHGTKDHDVSQNIAALLRHIEGTHRFAILDFGCGPGRDLKILHELGHDPIGVDGTARFVEMARAYSGCEVWHQDFLKLTLPQERFDGVFANASLFHVPRQELPRVLTELRACLKPRNIASERLKSFNLRWGVRPCLEAICLPLKTENQCSQWITRVRRRQ